MNIEKIFAVRLWEDNSLCEVKFKYDFDTGKLDCECLDGVDITDIKAIRMCDETGLNYWTYNVHSEEIEKLMLREFNKESSQAHSDMAERRLVDKDYYDRF